MTNSTLVSPGFFNFLSIEIIFAMVCRTVGWGQLGLQLSIGVLATFRSGFQILFVEKSLLYNESSLLKNLVSVF